MNSVKIAVRVRPLNSREKENNSFNVIQMKGKSTEITNPRDEKDTRTFTFDYSYWSMDSSEHHHADQGMVHTGLGRDMLRHAFDGYNTCIFAYGQTGSGKTYTMLGAPDHDHRGIIPRTCEELFEKIESLSSEGRKFKVEVSYFEIYCERLKDLLNPKNKERLRVREHRTLGPYIQGLLKFPVTDHRQISELMELGNKTRTVDACGRSQVVFTLIFSQREKDEVTQMWGEKVSKISLVDLAGSECAVRTGATGDRLKEAAGISQSLHPFGRVIHALANIGQKGAERPPYRDSVLTRIMKESLGGNCKTSMVATLSPSDLKYEETLRTLRFVDRAKQVVCKAVVNEDTNARMIRLLKGESLKMRQIIIQEDLIEKTKRFGLDISRPPGAVEKGGKCMSPASTQNDANMSLSHGIPKKEDSTEEMRKNEENLTQIQSSMVQSTSVNISARAEAGQINEFQRLKDEDWKNKLEAAEKRKTETCDYGVYSVITLGAGKEGLEEVKGMFSPKNTPHLVKLNEDPLMSESLIYYLEEGITRVGQSENCDIHLDGNYILPEHCQFENMSIFPLKSKVRLVPQPGSNTFVNGNRIVESTELNHGSSVVLGVHHVFRFNKPDEEGKKHRSSVLSFLDSIAKADYTLNQKNVQKSHRSHGSWNPSHHPEEVLDPYYRSSSPSSDYFSKDVGRQTDSSAPVTEYRDTSLGNTYF